MVRAVSILQCPDLDYCGFNWEFHFVSREKKMLFSWCGWEIQTYGQVWKLFSLRCSFLLSGRGLVMMMDDEERVGLMEGNSNLAGAGVYHFLVNKQTELCVMTWTSILRELDSDKGSWDNWIQLHLCSGLNFSRGEVLIGWFRRPMAFYLWGLDGLLYYLIISILPRVKSRFL